MLLLLYVQALLSYKWILQAETGGARPDQERHAADQSLELFVCQMSRSGIAKLGGR